MTEYTWKDLELFTMEGKAYSFKVKEVGVPKDYKVSYSEDGSIITNTYDPPAALPKTGSADMSYLLYAGLALMTLGGTRLRRK